MMRVLLASSLLSAAYGLILSNGRLSKDSGLVATDARSMLEYAQRTVEIAGICPDISGAYQGGNGKPVTISQAGCAVEVKMWWDAHNPEVIKTGTVDGASVSIKDFHQPGRFTKDGDVFFSDGGHWMKVVQDSPTLSDTVASHTQSVSRKSSSVVGETQKGKECADISGKYAANTGKDVTVYQNGCFVKVKTIQDDAVGEVILPGYIGVNDLHVKDFTQPGLIAEQGDITFADGGSWKKVGETFSAGTEDGTNTAGTEVAHSSSLVADSARTQAEDCVDASGDYIDKDGFMVIIAQTGCSLVVTGAWNLTGTIDDKLHFTDMESPGFITDAGDVFFSDGSHWKLSRKGAAIASEEHINDTSETMATDDMECADLSGKYQDAEGATITVYQIGCFVKVKMYWDESLGEVLKPGKIEGKQLTVKDFTSIGALTANDGGVPGIYFDDGAWWMKADEAVYGDSIDSMNNPSNASTAVETGGIDEAEEAVYGDSIDSMNNPFNASLAVETSGIDEANSTASNSDELSNPACKNLTGSYIDKRGETVAVSQTGCDVTVNLFWNEENGKVDVPGAIVDNQLHLGSDATGEFGRGHFDDNGDVFFENGGHWYNQGSTAQNASNTTAEGAVMTESSSTSTEDSDCSAVRGTYTDAEGKQVKIDQDGCLLKVTMYAEDAMGDVVKAGRIAGEVMRVQDVGHAGLVSSGGDIYFADGLHWKKAGDALNITADSQGLQTQGGVTAFAPPSDDDCTDVHGQYESSLGEHVTVYQIGCFLKVKYDLENEEKDILKSGRIVGEDVRVQDMHTFGRATEEGDIHFADGKHWSKKGSKGKGGNNDLVIPALANATGNLSEANTFASDTEAIDAAHLVESGEIQQDSTPAGNKDLVIAALANATGNLSEANTFGSDTEAIDAAHLVESGEIQQDSTPASSDDNCSDVHGAYQSTKGRAITVYQVG